MAKKGGGRRGKAPGKSPGKARGRAAKKAPRGPTTAKKRRAAPVASPSSAGRDASGASGAFAIEAARLATDLHCTDVLVLDVRGKSGMTDYIVVGSGTSDRQMRSVGDAIAALGRQMDYPAFRTDADERSTWLVLDCVDVVVHLFEPGTRAYYDIETMWGDAPRLKWARRAGARAVATGPRSSVRREDAEGEAEADTGASDGVRSAT